MTGRGIGLANAAKVPLTIYLKKIVFKTQRKTFQAPAIHEVLNSHIVDGQPVSDRHYPPLDAVDSETRRCMFIQDFMTYPGGAFRFSLCSYIPGYAPVQMRQSFDQPHAELIDEPIEDPETGDPREVVVIAHCLAFGEAFLLTMPNGLGGVAAVEDYLTSMLKKFVEKKHPKLHLFDVVPQDIHQEIERGGGVQEVALKMVHDFPGQSGSKYGEPVSFTKRIIGGTKAFTAVFRSASDGKLSTDDVLEAYDEYRNGSDELDDIIIRLKNGESIKGTEKLKLRKLVSVTATKGGNPMASEVQHAMRDFLGELSIEDDGVPRVLDTGGKFVGYKAHS